eukprot:6190570-Pleurochrysis_carterae.AAC.2
MRQARVELRRDRLLADGAFLIRRICHSSDRARASFFCTFAPHMVEVASKVAPANMPSQAYFWRSTLQCGAIKLDFPKCT